MEVIWAETWLFNVAGAGGEYHENRIRKKIKKLSYPVLINGGIVRCNILIIWTCAQPNTGSRERTSGVPQLLRVVTRQVITHCIVISHLNCVLVREHSPANEDSSRRWSLRAAQATTKHPR